VRDTVTFIEREFQSLNYLWVKGEFFPHLADQWTDPSERYFRTDRIDPEEGDWEEWDELGNIHSWSRELRRSGSHTPFRSVVHPPPVPDIDADAWERETDRLWNIELEEREREEENAKAREIKRLLEIEVGKRLRGEEEPLPQPKRIPRTPQETDVMARHVQRGLRKCKGRDMDKESVIAWRKLAYKYMSDPNYGHTTLKDASVILDCCAQALAYHQSVVGIQACADNLRDAYEASRHQNTSEG